MESFSDHHLPFPCSTFIDEYNLQLSALIGCAAPPINEKLFKFGAAYSCRGPISAD